MRKEGVVAAGELFAYFFFLPCLIFRSIVRWKPPSVAPVPISFIVPSYGKRVQSSWSSRQWTRCDLLEAQGGGANRVKRGRLGVCLLLTGPLADYYLEMNSE